MSLKHSYEFVWVLTKDTMTIHPSSRRLVELTRSGIVSVIALIVDFGLLVILKEHFSVYYLSAAAVSFSVGVVVNYALSVAWVFTKRKLESRRNEFLVFLAICIIGLVLNLIIISGAVTLFALDYRGAKAISTVVVFFWNFLVRKKLLY